MANKTISDMKTLALYLNLSEKELAWKETSLGVPLRITDYYLSLMDPTDPEDPLRRQVVPTSDENIILQPEAEDPLEEVGHSVNSRLIHRYKRRVAFLATDICPMYCRHCFRRRFTGNMCGPVSEEETKNSAAYLAEHPEVTEMLLTGGDPFSMSDSQLAFIIETFRKARPDLIIRLCTRCPVNNPSRITTELIDIFQKNNTAAFYLMTQFNHPREITPLSKKAIAAFVDNGIPAMNQTVLLKGVNDNADTLEELCNLLVAIRVKPYYLFQGDLVSGTSSFRVPIERGMEIERILRQRLSGLAMPVYALDLPQGGGKIPLCGSYIEEKNKGFWKFRTPNGEFRTYPEA